MKKNISINICGTIYAIDEDAYQLLDHYLDSMKRYFSQEGDEDIADDIEHRVAELLWEQKQNGRDAINIEIVKEIIEKIGNPADIADETTAHEEGGEYNQEEKTTDNQASDFKEKLFEFSVKVEKEADKTFKKAKSHMRNRRLYRDEKNKIFGGVCSGLAEYIGGDPVLWRIGFVLIALMANSISGHWCGPNIFHSFMPIFYIILWVVVPAAKTPEDKLRMKGHEVNPETLKEQIVSDIEEEEPQSPRPVNNNSGCLRIIFGIVMAIILMPLFCAFVAIIFGLIIMMAVALGLAPAFFSIIPGIEWLPEMIDFSSPSLWTGLLAGLFVIGLPIYAIIRVLRTSDKPMTSGAITSLILIWLLSIAVAFFACFYSAGKIQKFCEEHPKNLYWNLEATIDSIDNETIHMDSVFNEIDNDWESNEE